MAQLAQNLRAYQTRKLSPVNWLGFWTLYEREVRRFLKVYTQTLLAPVVTTLLYLAVFTLARSGASSSTLGVRYGEFVAPGLIMMSITQNAFANTSSSLMISKMQGTIVDILMPPLSAAETVLALVLGGATRGVLVGVVVAVTVAPFVPVHLAHPGLILFNAVSASLMLSTIGVLAALWSEKFDQMAAVTNFVILPLSFLSGTFYSVRNLPHWAFIGAHVDPIFYLIDGFRYGFIGSGDTDPVVGALVTGSVNAGLLYATWRLFKSGYKLKA
jgi:ABC-2 type transport system permease protein